MVSLRDRYIASFDSHSRADALRLLQLVQAECARLRQNPEAFLNKDVYKAFFALVNIYNAQIQETIRLWRDHHQRQEEVRKDVLESKLRDVRPNHSPDLVSQPYQQFLGPEAPAWPTEMKTAPHGSNTVKQMIPNGAIRIVEKWESQVKEIYRGLDQVSIRDLHYHSVINYARSNLFFNRVGCRRDMNL
jgi:hypothetical protein